MSYDLSQFYPVFFAEAAEHLDAMESLLLGLNHQAPDAEDLNAVFRTAHSIKGAAGTFGFTDMAELTHILEGLLDRVRKGELGLSDPLVDACLQARDVLHKQLATHRDGAPSDPDAASVIADRLAAFSISLQAPQLASTSASVSAGLVLEFYLPGSVPDQALLAEKLCRELSDFGNTHVLSSPSVEGQLWRIHIESCEDAEGAVGVVEFLAHDVHAITDESGTIAQQGGARKIQEESAFGLFEPEPAHADNEVESAYGLFSENMPTPNADSGDDSYGFFSALPPIAETITPPANKRLAANVDTTIRVGVDKVDLIINQVGELVITHAMLQQIASALDPVTFERLHNGLAQLERNSRDLQASIMTMRMVPISMAFSRFPRVVRDLSVKLGKQVELKISGESTELDRGLIERIIDPLTHLIRNGLDHGIESPVQRRAKGKSEVGLITLKAYQLSGTVVVEVGDDGAGLDRARILTKARERGMQVHDAMSDQAVWALIFEAGFSTADVVTDVSGRGVGMDVVKRNITALGGRIDIESMVGIGTRMTVRLPLTLAIVDGMSVAVGGESYIIPLGYVLESLQPDDAMVKRMGGVERLIQIRETYVPLIVLHELFGVRNALTDFSQGIIVLLEVDGRRAAVFVDALLGQHQVVIKSLETNYRKVFGIAAATIMGDGRVAFVLDAVALVSKANAAVQAAA